MSVLIILRELAANQLTLMHARYGFNFLKRYALTMALFLTLSLVVINCTPSSSGENGVVDSGASVAQTTAISSPTQTPAPSPTQVAAPTPTPLTTANKVPTPTSIPTPKATVTQVPTPTSIPTPKATATQVPTPTSIPTPKATATQVPTPTSTPTPTATATQVPTATVEPVPTPLANLDAIQPDLVHFLAGDVIVPAFEMEHPSSNTLISHINTDNDILFGHFSAVFENPHDGLEMPWSHGFVTRLNDASNNFVTAYLTSIDDNCLEVYVNNEIGNPVHTGYPFCDGFNYGSGEANRLDVVTTQNHVYAISKRSFTDTTMIRAVISGVPTAGRSAVILGFNPDVGGEPVVKAGSNTILKDLTVKSYEDLVIAGQGSLSASSDAEAIVNLERPSPSYILETVFDAPYPADFDDYDFGFELTALDSTKLRLIVRSNDTWELVEYSDEIPSVKERGGLPAGSVNGSVHLTIVVTPTTYWFFVGEDTQLARFSQTAGNLIGLKPGLVAGHYAEAQHSDYPTNYRELRFWSLPTD